MSKTQNFALQLGWWLWALGAEEYVRQEAGWQSPSYMDQTPSGTFSCTHPKRTGKWKYLPNPLPLPGAFGKGKGLGSTECDRNPSTEDTCVYLPRLSCLPKCGPAAGWPGRRERPVLLSGLGPKGLEKCPLVSPKIISPECCGHTCPFLRQSMIEFIRF